MDRQQPLIGTQVDNVTLFIGRTRDDGKREVYIALTCGVRLRQRKAWAESWVSTDQLVTIAANVVYEVETGQAGPLTCLETLQERLNDAAAEPF